MATKAPADAGLHLLATASSHQGDCKYGPFAGSQCLSVCVYYLASSYVKEAPVDSREGLDDVLLHGSQLDRLLRTANFIPFNAFAQLSNVPKVLTTHLWSCAIETSPELYGLLSDECVVCAPFIMSLRKALELNYFDIDQYILYICNGKSGAIIIKNKTYFIFDPHCSSSRDTAAVFTSASASSIVSYIGEPGREYTACHLYFIPAQASDEPVNEYLLANYGIPSSLKRSGAYVNLKTLQTQVMSDTTQAFIPQDPISSLGGQTEPPQDGLQPPPHPTFVAASDFLPKDTPLATPPRQPEIPGALSLKSALHAATVKRKRIAASPLHSNTESDDSETGRKTTPMKVTKPNEVDMGEVETFWLDDDISTKQLLSESSSSEKNVPESILSSSDWDTDSLLSPHGSPPATPSLKPSHLDNTSTFSLDNEELGGSTLQLHDKNYYKLDFSNYDNISKLITSLEEHIEKVSQFPHKIDMPVIVDPSVNKCYREAVALYTIDSLLANVIEQGLISKPEHKSQALNILRYIAIWLNKLSIYTNQVQDLIDTELYIPNIHQALLARKFDGKLEAMLTEKILKCFQAIHGTSTEEIKALSKMIQASIKNTPFHDRAISVQGETENLKSTVSAPYIITTEEEAEKLQALVADLWKVIQEHNNNVSHEDSEFHRAVNAVKNFLPIPGDIQQLDYTLTDKAEYLGEAIQQMVASITQECRTISTSMLSSIQSNMSFSTDIPDFFSLRGRISTTFNNIQTGKSHLGLDSDKLQKAQQQLAYLGHEISAITNSQWSTDYTEPVTPVPELTEIQSQLKIFNTRQQNQQMLQGILDEVESMLHAAKSEKTEQGLQKLAMLLPSIEAYLENAGTLLGPEGNAQFDRLRKEITDLISSVDVMLAYVKNISAHTLATDAQTISNFPPDSKQQQVFQRALTDKVQDLFAQINASLKTDRPPTFTENDMAALESLAVMSNDSTLATAAAFYTKITLLLKSEPDCTVPLYDIAHLKSQLATANINSATKRSLYMLLAQLNKETAAKKGVDSNQTVEPQDTSGRSQLSDASTIRDTNKTDKPPKPKKPQTLLLTETPKSLPKPTKPQEVSLPASPSDLESKPFEEKSSEASPIESTPPPLSPDSSVDSHGGSFSLESEEEFMDTFSIEDHKISDTEQNMDVDDNISSHLEKQSSPPETSSQSLSALVQQEERLGEEQAWKKIQIAFKNLDFSNITYLDWIHVTGQTQSSSLNVAETFAPTLESLMSPLLQRLKKMTIGAALSLTTYGQPFKWPPIDWMTPYKNNVLFYLITVHYPSIVDLAEQSHAEISVLLQLQSSDTLLKGTAGTYLESDSRNMLDIVSSIEDAASDYKLNVHTEVEKWTHQVHNIVNTGDPPPPKPDIIVPSKLLNPTFEQTMASFNKDFRDYVYTVERHLLADLSNDFQLLRVLVTETENGFQAWEKDTASKLLQLISQDLQNAPIGVRQYTVPNNEPLTLFDKLVHDSEVSSKLTYREAVAALHWVEATCAHIATQCQYPAVGAKLQAIIGLIAKTKPRLESLVSLENEANDTDDINTIKRAISSLDPKRVTGGAAKVQEWSQKAKDLEKLLADTELETSVVQSLQLLRHLALAARSTNLLANLKQKVSSLYEKWTKEQKTSSGNTLSTNIKELDLYISFKLRFIEYYETNQVYVFSNFALPASKLDTKGALTPLTPQSPHFDFNIDASSQVPPLNFTLRLEAMCHTNSAAVQPVWIQTIPTVDNLSIDYIPVKNTNPLSLQVIFNNFLETHFIRASLDPQRDISQYHGSTVLPNILQAHFGTITTRIINSQWNNLLENSTQALQSYTTIHSTQETPKQNEFMSIIVAIHGLLQSLSSSYLDTPSHPNTVTVALSFRTILEILLWIWPKVIYYFLRMKSFQEGVSFLQIMLNRCLLNLPSAFVIQYVTNNLRMAGVPEPIGNLFCPKYWTPLDPQAHIWSDEKFLQLCANSKEKARACFLACALESINEVVLGQLWRSLRPIFLQNVDTPYDLLKILMEAAYKPASNPKVSSKTRTDETPAYSYGSTTNSILKVECQTTKPQSVTVIPISGFEMAAAAILQKFNPIIYISSGRPVASHEFTGDIFVVSPLLDCTGNEEPFSSLLAAPLQPVSENTTLASLYTPLEKDIFTSQKLWLQQNLSSQSSSPQPRYPIVLLDNEHKLTGAYYLPNNISPPPLHNLHFTYDGKGLPTWPMETLQASTLSYSRQQALEDKTNDWIEDMENLDDALCIQNMFTAYPSEIHSTYTDSDSEDSGGYSLPTSPTPQMLQAPLKPHGDATKLPTARVKDDFPAKQPRPVTFPTPLLPCYPLNTKYTSIPKRTPHKQPARVPFIFPPTSKLATDQLLVDFEGLSLEDRPSRPKERRADQNYLAPPHVKYINLQPPDPQRVIVGTLSAADQKSVFTPSQPVAVPAEARWASQIIPPSDYVLPARYKRPSHPTGATEKRFTIIQESHQDPTIPLLLTQPPIIESARLFPEKGLTVAHMQKSFRDKKFYVCEKPTRNRLLSAPPSIAPNHLSIHEILADRASLVAPRPPFIPIDENLDIEPIFVQFIMEVSIEEAKNVLITFIKKIKQAVTENAQLLASSVQRLAALYL
ncbi:orf64 [Alcelaphine gammaherpesvirus 2]|uniref:Orf64 n=1 Tax=Alcelaphine gammaherpesvirus 2 TaxID=138184 RepID=A0A068AAM4_9GAMA|nr:orf64 [Alcelaphine gammaherpesvirus 2]AIA62101.1 orf64 [Alcelaphine gammaherpesvirus 2]